MGTSVDSISENGLKWEYWFEQGNSLHCTLYAISRAICNAGKTSGYRFLFEEVRSSMLELMTLQCGAPSLEIGWYPEDFDDRELPFIFFRGTEGQEEGICNIRIEVTELKNWNEDPRMFLEEFVLVDSAAIKTQRDHCMQVICAITDEVDQLTYFVCRENKDIGERLQRYQKIHTLKPSNTMYMVTIAMNDDFTPPQSPTMNQKKEPTYWGPERRSNEESLEDILQNLSLGQMSSAPQWAATYIPGQNGHSRTLQCISYAISECCKDTFGFYVKPDDVQANIIGLFQYIENMNILEPNSPDPEKFNKKILNFDKEHIIAYGNNNFDPQIEIGVKKEKPYEYNEESEYLCKEKQKKRRCYYVINKSNNGSDNFFVCRDIATVIGPKQERLPGKYVQNDEFTLYKVHVNQWIPEHFRENGDVDFEAMDTF